jgi:hypothetical protein
LIPTDLFIPVISGEDGIGQGGVDEILQVHIRRRKTFHSLLLLVGSGHVELVLLGCEKVLKEKSKQTVEKQIKKKKKKKEK